MRRYRMGNETEYPSCIIYLAHVTLFVVGMNAVHLHSCVRNLCGSRFWMDFAGSLSIPGLMYIISEYKGARELWRVWPSFTW